MRRRVVLRRVEETAEKARPVPGKRPSERPSKAARIMIAAGRLGAWLCAALGLVITLYGLRTLFGMLSALVRELREPAGVDWTEFLVFSAMSGGILLGGLTLIVGAWFVDRGLKEWNETPV